MDSIDFNHVLLAAFLVIAGIMTRKAFFDPSPTPAGQPNRRLREYRWLDPQKKWAECPCCGCPTLNCSQAVSVPTCVVCEWEETDDDEGELTRARENFRRYGVAYSPEEAATWGGTPPSREEVAAKLEIVQLSRKNREREQDFGAWAADMQLLLVALASARAQRVEDAVPGVPEHEALEAPRPADGTTGPALGAPQPADGRGRVVRLRGWPAPRRSRRTRPPADG